MSQMNWDREVDVLVVGTGNGGLTAAVCNWEMGTKDVLIIEKQDKVGGTSATSGGGFGFLTATTRKRSVLRTVLRLPRPIS